MKIPDPLGPVTLDEWMNRFPLRRWESLYADFNGIEHVCAAEHMRRLALAGEMRGNTWWPMDMLILAYGEPRLRSASKIGGLPYRPGNVSWPVSPLSGRPLRFVAQFRFTESVDLLGPLPGDVLLVFFDEDRMPDGVHCEWYKLGLPDSQLVNEASIPTMRSGDPRCYGVRCRYADTIDEGMLDTMWEIIVSESNNSMEDMTEVGETERRNHLRAFAGQLCCFKIGGVPYWGKPLEALVEHSHEGKFLGTIPPVLSSDLEKSWMWRELVYDGVPCEETALIIGDEECLHLYLDKNGSVQPRLASLKAY